MSGAERPADPAVRARDWVRAGHADICDQLIPWESGTVVRASRAPDYYSYNLVRVEREPAMDAEALIDFTGAALSPLAHRRLDFEVLAAAERLRPEFISRGWSTDRLVWMLHEGPAPSVPPAPVSEVYYDDVAHLRAQWHREDSGEEANSDAFYAQAREVALRRRLRVLAAHAAGRPIGFASLEARGRSAEITHVYVDPAHRGQGLGTALTAAAIGRAGEVDELWICADEEGRPRRLYERLGFRGVWSSMIFELPPQPV